MIEIIQAVHVWGEIEEKTRLKPLRVDCENGRGDRFEVYVKLLARSDQGTQAFVNETLGGLLARLLKLNAPEPLAVRIPQELLPALAQRHIAEDILRSEGLQFGSRSLGAAWHTAGGVPLKIARAGDLRDALLILLMDLIIENGDRVVNNPNLLVSAKGLAPIDHELAFSNFPYPYGGSAPFRPWEAPFLHRAKQLIENHLLFATLRRRKLDFAGAEARFLGIQPKEIRALAGQIPPGWVNPATPPDRITDYLIQARKNLPALLNLVEHTLSRP